MTLYVQTPSVRNFQKWLRRTIMRRTELKYSIVLRRLDPVQTKREMETISKTTLKCVPDIGIHLAQKVKG